MKEHTPLRGALNIKLFDSDGSLALEIHTHNVLTELGEAYLADRVCDEGVTKMSHMAIGSGTGGSSASTALESESGRVALDSTTQGAGADDNDAVFVATFPSGTGTGTVSEVGILNASPTGGTLMNYSDDFAAFVKGGTQSAVITVTLTLGLS